MKKYYYLTCLWLPLASAPLHAQLVPDGASATLANVTTNITGTVTGWTAQASLHFASPTVTGAGARLNGNSPSNRRVFASVPVPGLNMPPGHCVHECAVIPDALPSCAVPVSDWPIPDLKLKNESINKKETR